MAVFRILNYCVKYLRHLNKRKMLPTPDFNYPLANADDVLRASLYLDIEHSQEGELLTLAWLVNSLRHRICHIELNTLDSKDCRGHRNGGLNQYAIILPQIK